MISEEAIGLCASMVAKCREGWPDWMVGLPGKSPSMQFKLNVMR